MQTPNLAAAFTTPQSNSDVVSELTEKAASAATSKKCYFCGLKYHPRSRCPARDAICNKCRKVGHYQRVCQSKDAPFDSSAALQTAPHNLLHAFLIPSRLTKSCLRVEVNSETADALIDSGSTDNFIHPRHVVRCSLKIHSGFETVSMASSSSSKKLEGQCLATINVQGNTYPKVKLYVFSDLYADIILGQDWQAKHASVTIEYGGNNPQLKVCNLTTLNVAPPPLFEHLTPQCKPIAAPSRKYCQEDRIFIAFEITRMLSEGIIEPSNFSWRAQVVATKNRDTKRDL